MVNLSVAIKKVGLPILYYSRSRPRFKLHLAVDAILSVALVLAGFQIATLTSQQKSNVLKISGAVAFSAEQLERFVKEENLVGYWVGPNSDDKYTVVATTPGEVTISYFPKDADIHILNTSILVVHTHKNRVAADAQIDSHEVSGGESSIRNDGSIGDPIIYNPATPTKVTVTIKNGHATVTIFNSIPDASLALAMKSGAIQQIT